MFSRQKIAVVGLGYVGLNTAIAFGKKFPIIGYDIDAERIAQLKEGYDKNNERTKEQIRAAKIKFTTDVDQIKEANFYLVSVPTILDESNRPELSALFEVSMTLGKQLKKGNIVVYESTVYPGVTEEKCIPLLEQYSKLKCGHDFFVGFSPERINPHDKVTSYESIIKVISAVDKPTLDTMAAIYKKVIKAGVYPVSSIRVAEATKIIENVQRDVNIALMNEISMILHGADINMKEALNAAATKWNFLPFFPGLVGGHCIALSSYYLAYKAEELGYEPSLLLAGRRVNERIPKWIAAEIIKKLINQNINIRQARIGILGITYKADYADVHDTKVIDIINQLKEYNVEIIVHDPLADPALTKQAHGIVLSDWDAVSNLDLVLLAVRHSEYRRLNEEIFEKILKKNGIVMDLTESLKSEEFANKKISFWQL